MRLEQQVLHKPLQQEALQREVVGLQALEPALPLHHTLPRQQRVLESVRRLVRQSIDFSDELSQALKL